jgi:hypothetical protein
MELDGADLFNLDFVSVKTFTLFALGLAIAAMGIYVADADDAPGAAVIGMLLMVVGVVLGVRAARNRLPMWAARAALAVGVVVAAFAAFLTHAVVVTAPLFPQSQEVPSVVDSAPSPQYTAAVTRARELVRSAVLEHNLPGVSVAVGARRHIRSICAFWPGHSRASTALILPIVALWGCPVVC